jgi:hypothetical protein
MAREPKFIFKDKTFNAALVKVDRDKVYGWTETKYLDSNGKACNFVNILDDGRTMIGAGGLAYKTIDEAANEVDKSTLLAKYADGSDAVLKPSVFDIDNILSTEKKIGDYLSMDVKGVYQLTISEGLEDLVVALNEYKVLYFPFNYRAGYESDDAFLLNQGNIVFAVTGRITDFTYATLDVPVALTEESEEGSGDDFDFNMF